jgi:large subunit ribosomal protein L11
MPEVVINGLIEGGKATSGPPFGPALGPLGMNIAGIVDEINKKTKPFAGIKVPVKVIVDPATKQFKVEVGAPPTSALILKELGIAAGAKGKDDKVGNITLAQIKGVAESKAASLYGDEKSRVKQVIGTCKSMGVTCEGMDPREYLKKIDSGEVKL